PIDTSHVPPINYFTHGPTLAYRTFGSGPLHVLAFHGFGRSGADFEVLEPSLKNLLTIHAFDLHFHGKSPGYPERANTPFTPKELADYFASFADRIGATRVGLLGYSLGGRIALSLAEQMPQRLDVVLLAAPDGLHTRPWYRRLAASSFGRALYRRFVMDPSLIHALIKTMRALRLMNERMFRFLMGQTDSRAKRELVRDVWLSYRLIEPDLHKVAANAVEHNVPVHLFFGTYDKVIKAHQGANLHSLAPNMITQTELPLGHALLTAELGAAMRDRLLHDRKINTVPG
ncbi:MAG TPA: alpha/beta hydrolase, partial [Flavobacteriales bacterium]|nr:alpha/beta hydrolase [Flavobacteriales bacterium]